MSIYPSNFVIYKISNNINEKVYIGKSVNFIRRKQHHEWSVRESPTTVIHQTIKRLKIENFQFDTIFTVLKESDLNWAEIELITQWDCCYLDDWSKGYNGTRGGDGGNSETIQEIQNNLVILGKHNWQGDGTLQRNNVQRRLDAGTHNWQGEIGSINSTILYMKRKVNGTHNFLNIQECEYCGETGPGNVIENYHRNYCPMNPDKIPRKTNATPYEVRHISWENNSWLRVASLNKFCISNKIPCGGMYDVANGKLEIYKDWYCKKL